MNLLTKITFALFISFFACLNSISPAVAATSQAVVSQKTMKVQITIIDPDTFWNYPYINRESEVAKPALIQVEWSIGDLGNKLTKTTIVVQGKATGETAIVTDKDALVNLRIIACDAKGRVLGTSSALENNRGQTKSFSITAPDFTEPKITIN